MKKKNKKSVMEQLREIRDKISLETMDMGFEELKKYLARHSKIHNASVWKNKYKAKTNNLMVAEPRANYGMK